MAAMEDLAMAFNGLPRPQTVPWGSANYWVFSIGQSPLHPSAQILIAVHPPTMVTLHSGPVQLLNGGSILDNITTVVSMLLDVFIKGLRDPTGEQVESTFAPLTWAMSGDEEIHEVIQQKLEECGVHEALCSVRRCTPGEKKDIIDEQFSKLFATGAIQLGDASRCHRCYSEMSVPLKRCSACNQAFYCSPKCEAVDWQRHQAFDCPANRPNDC
ncbi:hypothetical protein HII31_07859 [Pseudocercospora fuligena]|uniref:MYND-type domain-containing protein n=1 Tax=Pseudocercospora fuligena TaxID=685502 RepID=A0A8H6VL35_9PEZI|nr:hypothetical protein HII31_07859 [Pseudocercospora fuligena]